MKKEDIVKRMEELKIEMFRAGVDYEIICEYSAVIGDLHREAMREDYKPITWAEFTACCEEKGE